MRFTPIDFLKTLAAQLIVLHHMVAYGPLSISLEHGMPALAEWLFQDARMAVQMFLVMGGFLAAHGLLARPVNGFPVKLLANRYLRLTLPFMAAIGVAMLCALLVRPWLQDDMVPGAPGLLQILAHALLLHGVVDQESLSAGAWYVAIDMQLFALLAIIFWAVPHVWLRRALIVVLTVLSLFVCNRNPALDDYAIYFFGAYGMGVLAYGFVRAERFGMGVVTLTVLGVAACFVEWRARIALACFTACILCVVGSGARLSAQLEKTIAYFGRTSYSLFLIHFPLLLIVNALYAHGGLNAGVAVLLFWLGANLAADLFYRWVELPSMRIRAEHFTVALWKSAQLVRTLIQRMLPAAARRND